MGFSELRSGFFDDLQNVGAQFDGDGLDFLPQSIECSIGGDLIRRTCLCSSDDADDLVTDLDDDSLGGINDDLFAFVQLFDDLGFQFLNLGFDVITNIVAQFVGSLVDFVHNVLCILNDLDSEFVDADDDFVSLLDDEVFVVFNIFLEFVQSFDDLWFVFVDLSLDVSIQILEGLFYFSPSVLEVNNDFLCSLLDLDDDKLSFLGDDLNEFVSSRLDFVESFLDLGGNFVPVGFEEVTDVGVGFCNSSLDFLPEITESTFLNKGVVVGVSHHFSDDELNNSLLDDDENFLSGIDQDLFHLGQFFHDFLFVLVQDAGSNHLGESGQFLGDLLHFFPQIFHVIHDSVSVLLRFSNLSPSDDGDDLITDGDHDLLVRVQDYLFHGVQSLDDLGLVLGDQSLHLFFGDSNKVISSSLYFLPDFVQISKDLNTLIGHFHPDFLGSFNNDFLEFVQVSLSFGQSGGDLGFQSLIFVLEEVTDLGVGALDGFLEFSPGVFDSTFLHVGEFIIRLDRVVSNNDLSNIVDDTDKDGLSGLDESFLHLVQLFHDEGFVLFDDVDDNFLHFSAQVLGGFLDFFPCSLQFVLDSVSFGSRYSAGDSSDDTGDLVFDFDVDLGGSINDNLFGVVQFLNDNWFEFFNLSLNVVFQVSLEFVHDIIGIFDDLHSEFVNADMDFLGLFNDEVFVVFNIFLEFVQSFNDLWFVFLDLSLDEFISLNLSVHKSSH